MLEYQKIEKTANILNSAACLLYTWENAVGKRELEWSSGDVKAQKTSLIQVSLNT